MLYGLQDCCEWVANSALVFLAENNCSHCHEQLCNLYLWNDVKKKKKRSTCCLLAFVNTRTRRGQHESLGFLKSCGRDCAPQSVFSGPAAAAASPGRVFNVQTLSPHPDLPNQEQNFNKFPKGCRVKLQNHRSVAFRIIHCLVLT